MGGFNDCTAGCTLVSVSAFFVILYAIIIIALAIIIGKKLEDRGFSNSICAIGAITAIVVAIMCWVFLNVLFGFLLEGIMIAIVYLLPVYGKINKEEDDTPKQKITTWKCEWCGHINKGGSHCIKCGGVRRVTKVSIESDKWTCSCGQENRGEAKACINCGKAKQ